MTQDPERADTIGRLVKAARLDFPDLVEFRRSTEGAGVLYNTQWIRFGPGRTTLARAVDSSRGLFEAVARAGVGRIV